MSELEYGVSGYAENYVKTPSAGAVFLFLCWM